jgi:acyl-CoA thioesterase
MTAFTPKQQPFPAEIPFLHDLGVEFHGMADGRAEIALTLQPRHMNSWHVTHGGVVMTLLDVVMAHAARSVRDAADHGAPGIVTVEMKTSFMRPCVGKLMATGHLLHGTRSMAFCEGSVRDESGALCAHATGTFKLLRSLKRGAEIGAAS